MEIIGKSPNLWMNKIVNFNGIYKVNAEIKDIIKIEDRNCILWTLFFYLIYFSFYLSHINSALNNF